MGTKQLLYLQSLQKPLSRAHKSMQQIVVISLWRTYQYKNILFSTSFIEFSTGRPWGWLCMVEQLCSLEWKKVTIWIHLNRPNMTKKNPHERSNSGNPNRKNQPFWLLKNCWAIIQGNCSLGMTGHGMAVALQPAWHNTTGFEAVQLVAGKLP